MPTTLRLLACASLVAVLFPSCTATRLDPKNGLTEQDMSKLTDNAKMQAALKERGLLLRLKKGEKLPLQLTLKGDVITTQGSATIPLRVQRDCSVFFSTAPAQSRLAKLFTSDDMLSGILISFDGKHYKPIQQSTRGSFNVSLSRDTNTGASAKLDLEALAR